MTPLATLRRYLPILDWGRRYDRASLRNDLVAAVIVTIMLIPQSLAYAMLAGLPPEAGLYASIVPILLYAIFGTSRALAVGPVAVVSLLTASALGEVAAPGSGAYAAAALTLAFLSGAVLLALGLLRLGFLANFLSHPVISGFITASGLLIAAGQLKHVLGVPAGGETLIGIGLSLAGHLGDVQGATLAIGGGGIVFLLWVRRGLGPFLRRLGLGAGAADMAVKGGPVVAVIASTLAVRAFGLADQGVAVVGIVPQSLPPLTLPAFSPQLLRDLAVPALMISVIGFVESVSVAKTLAARKRQRIDPDQELIGLGAANIGAAFTGGFPVTGGFSRSVVNADAGAETPAAGAFTAVGLGIAAMSLTPLLHDLPKATLAATIIVAVLSLVDLSILRRTWRNARPDFAVVATTILLTLLMGVEIGVGAGVILSLALHLYKTSRPHVAEVGLIPGTQHFRNVLRHDVETAPGLLMLRVDESLFFVNAHMLEDLLRLRLAADRGIRDVVLMCSAVNVVDFSAEEGLEALNHMLRDAGIGLHLAEVKGPVMDRLRDTHFLHDLNGKVFQSQFDAWVELTGTAGPQRAAE
ncbi:SulP family inorganic anion transporter [Pseudooceanicola algae]|uniref:Putative sulfate transporter n=1 Tax=Pseudooceanicola algae TaxID=1537215 RepID=A0A418SE19_9RHOB|nr:sulfate permease [Pseudooceanicola algae]QPM89604.1 putative sulfate transporter [Pseudooceanicola algae]